jgi:aspartate aminotransferase-like enzyme
MNRLASATAVVASQKPTVSKPNHAASLSLDGVQHPLRLGPYLVKQAISDDELAQLHELNYRTFVQEVRQYEDNGSGQLVDKFHDKNVYFVALHGKQVIGMIAVHGEPPFSIEDKLKDPSVLEDLPGPLLEVRLLAIDPMHRNKMVFAALSWKMMQYAHAGGFSHLLISGVDDRLELYERLGFRPLGSPVRSGKAVFVPMAMDVLRMTDRLARDMSRYAGRLRRLDDQTTQKRINLLPGPVQLAPHVIEALGRPPVSHRARTFVDLYERVRRELSELVGGIQCAVFTGSGTLGNDVVAASLAADPLTRRGLVLVNGEFGRRLVGQAKRFGLTFEALEWPWGQPWDFKQIAAILDRDADINWVWAVHLETSTGLVNDLRGLKRIARDRGLRICLDCVSSLGSFDFDLRGVHLASGASGKALGGVAGMAIVFASEAAIRSIDSSRVPNCLDLVSAMQTTGPRFTCSSGPVLALAAALEGFRSKPRRLAQFDRYRQLGEMVRQSLVNLGIQPMVEGTRAAPVITTFSPPRGMTATELVARSRRAGFEIAGESQYLRDRGLLQIAAMGDVSLDQVRSFFELFDGWIHENRHSAAAGS